MASTALKPRGQRHLVHRVGWLRAAVLGANDGIISIGSLMVGVAAAQASSASILLTGVAALVAGAVSMAAGEYVSVSSQADIEDGERSREAQEQLAEPAEEMRELVQLYVDRGLDPALARQVAAQLMARDPVGTHLRDELGISQGMIARPVQAALASAASFCAGAIIPVLLVLVVPSNRAVWAITATTLVLLAVLGAVGARAGGANTARGAARVMFWGALAMAATALVGRFFGAVA